MGGPPGGQPPFGGPPGWQPPPPRPPSGGNTALIIVIVAGVVLAFVLGGGVLIWALSGDDDDRPSAFPSATYTPPSFTPPTYTPPSYTPPTTPAEPDSYGAIAVARDGSYGRSWDYDTMSGAKKRAIKECPRSGCKILTTFVNSCGAVAFNSRTNRYWGGSGATTAKARRDAISNAGGGRIITSVCAKR